MWEMLGYITMASVFIVSLGDHVVENATGRRRTKMASVGALSLMVGLLFGTLFFTQVTNAEEKSGAQETATTTASPAPPNQGVLRRVELEGDDKTPPRQESNGLPEWTSANPVRQGKLHTETVASDHFDTEPEALKDLDRAIQEATGKYIDYCLAHDGASRHVGFSTKEIKSRWLKTEEPLVKHDTLSVGEMVKAYAQLEFTPEFRSTISHKWEDFVAKSRLWQVGLAGGGLLLVLVVMFGYFSLDTATRGFYKGRLQFLMAIAILALIGAGLYFAKLIPWV